MTAKLLEGKEIAGKIKVELKREVDALKAKKGASPKLVVVQIGESASSDVYLKAQARAAETIGVAHEVKRLPEGVSQTEVEAAIAALDRDTAVTAILLQMPVPKALDAKRLMRAISPAKDAEGMHPENLGKILSGDYRIGPCTAMAVMAVLESVGQKLHGKEAVVVGHSEIAGKPLSLMLLNKFATTTVCHIATSERGLLAEHVKRAEILVVAVGKAGVVKGDWIKEGAIVIDVGINKVGDKVVGDVEFDAASNRASYITPVPGGVGPVTAAMLMRNVVELYR
jgi:methylenetetrahydrofolate dehydrogenase (NADP+)/methenyltetrahydrofolate cyclohydrolase